MFVVTYETVLFWWAMIQSIMTPPLSRSLLIGWLMLRFMSSTSSAEKQTQKFFSSLWENSAFCMNRWHHSRPACSLAVMSEQTDAICPSRDSVWRHQTETANSRANSESAVRLRPASYFLLPASFNARLMFLKGSCSGNIQHGRREEKKTSRLVSLMEHHQCCSSPTLSASFSSQFQFLIFVSSDFYNICDNYNYCNVTTADL